MAPRCWHWAGSSPKENFMGEGVCKERHSMIMVGFWNKRTLLGNVLMHSAAGNSWLGHECADPNEGPCYDRKRVPNACSPPVRVLSRQIFRQCFVAWLGGDLPRCNLFLQRLSRPTFGATLWTHFGAFAAHFLVHCADPYLEHCFGFLIQSPKDHECVAQFCGP